MAINKKNKYPADKSGTKYSEFKNTKRTPPGKTRAESGANKQSGSTNQAAVKTP